MPADPTIQAELADIVRRLLAEHLMNRAAHPSGENPENDQLVADARAALAAFEEGR